MLTLQRQHYLKLRDGVWLDQTPVLQRQQRRRVRDIGVRGARAVDAGPGEIRTWWAGEGLLLRDEEVVVSPLN
jgi:hypothetical protein